MTEREFALSVVRILQQAGFMALWAGGCVRDELLGLNPDDYDVATDAKPADLRPLFRHRNEIGVSFGVVQVIGPRGEDRDWLTVEVATLRSDGTYTDGRRPDAVTFSSPEEDATRRDFTINGMFFDPVKQQLIDYVGGQADLQAKILRAIGDPTARFTEDKLRILRAVRMATRFDLAIDPETLFAAKRMAPEIRAVSPERIATELRKLLSHRNRGRGVRLLREFGLIEPVLPELADSAIWERAVRVIDALAEVASFPLAFAALLREQGKVGVEEIAERLRLSSAEKNRVAWLLQLREVLLNAPTMQLSVLKPILIHPGIAELLSLHRAEALAEGRSTGAVAFCEAYLQNTSQEELNPPPLLTGEDLIASGLKPGPEFKRLLDAARAAQLDGRIRTKAEGLQLLEELRSANGPVP